MNRILIATTVALSLISTVATADAASRTKHRGYHHHSPAWAWSPAAMRTVGPRWAGPAECFTDEGYGRYQSCDAGRR